MSQTWNLVVIRNPGAITVETLESLDAFNGNGSMWESHEIDTVGVDDEIYAQGRSKYHCEDLEQAIYALSAEHPQATFMWLEEWSHDEPGAEVTVIRGGQFIPEESEVQRMVPANLNDLIANVRSALKEGGSSLEATARALITALDPEGEPA